MTKTIWETTYTLEGNTISFEGTRGNGSFESYEGVGNSVCDFENVCHAHFENVLANKEEDKMTDKIIEAIQNSSMFISLNSNIKDLYEKEGRTASEEEYQAVRNMIITKVMAEDKNIMELIAKETYKQFNS